MFFEPSETPWDLRWRMLDTDIRVNPWFWLMSAVLGWPLTNLGYEFLFVWVVCVFISILVHEFGHVLAGRLFGTRGNIVLYSFGGLAIGSSNLDNRWKRIGVYLAGPGAGFVLYGLVWLIFLAAEPGGFREQLSPARAAIQFLFEINLWWGLLNLMPVYPLDGGQVSRDTFDWLIPGGRGLKVAFGLSAVIAIALALLAGLWLKQMYTAIMFGLLAVSSFQMLQQTQVRGSGDRYSSDDRAPWERDPDSWKHGRDRDQW